jgi:ferritin-like metal-binding protein YciE
MGFMKAVQSVMQDEFENVLVAELQELRKTEKALQKMYPRLKSKPQLRTRFLQQLADMQQRAYRLDAVLNPTGALQFASSPQPVRMSAQPSVA